MSDPGIVFLFPAFASDYKDNLSLSIPGYAELFKVFLTRASDSTDSDLTSFDPDSHNFLENELKNQYIAYIQSCTCASILRSKEVKPGIQAYYSMGIYAALFNSGSVTFETGLDLIKSAFTVIRNILQDESFSMCSIIGLNIDDIRHLILLTDQDTEVSNQNGEFSFILSGRLSSLKQIISQAKEEGAIHTGLFAVKVPYHSQFLRETQSGFSEFIGNIRISDPETPILSSLDQILLTTSGQIKSELIRNLYNPFNWYKTHMKLSELGFRIFIECSPVPSLIKIARFIPGEVKYLTPLSAIGSPLFSDTQ